MDAYKRLKAEISGIEGQIKSYTDDDIIVNYINQLKKAIEDKDIELLRFSLQKIKEWYDKALPFVSSNQFVSDRDQLAHRDNIKLISSFIEDFSTYKFPIEEATKSKETTHLDAVSKVIFLSHKSDDKKYGDALRNFIIGLGVPDNALIYTSHPLHKIPMDKNIYDYLRENISGNVFVIFLWSDAYLDSPACLNEMGAAWVAQKDYTNIYVPTFHFGNPKYHQCAVDTRKMGAVLNGDAHCKMSMIELKNKIQGLFDLKNDEAKSQYLLDQFMKEITEA